MLPLLQSSYFGALLESLNTGAIIVNSEGTVYAVNSFAERLLDFARDDMLRRDVADVLKDRIARPEDFLALLHDAKGRVARVSPLSLKYRPSDGRVLYLSLTASLLIEYDKLFGVFLQFHDITGLVELHEQEKRLLEEQAALQLERVTSLKNFAMAVAHQIRNPLTAIGGFAGRLLRKKSESDPESEALSVILSAANRLQGIVGAVSDYAANPPPLPCEVDIAALASQAVREWRARGDSLARPDLLCSLEPATLKLDTLRLSRLLREILQNALEALPVERGVIVVSGKRVAGGYRLEIADNGPGMAPDILPYVFDPFFTTKAVGVGMGLTKARQWVMDMGGSITLENRSAGGTQAVIFLPGPVPEPARDQRET